MGKISIISLIFLGIFGVLVVQESPYWLYSIPFLVLGFVILMIKGMWDVSGCILNQIEQSAFEIEIRP